MTFVALISLDVDLIGAVAIMIAEALEGFVPILDMIVVLAHTATGATLHITKYLCNISQSHGPKPKNPLFQTAYTWH